MSLIPRNFYLDDIFEDLEPRGGRINDMKCDVYEKDNKYFIELDIPGYSKEDIKIECNEGYLTINAEKHAETKEEKEGKKYLRRERIYGRVTRTFNFSDIDQDNIKAEFNNGILKVTVPKTEKIETKKIIEID